MVYRNPITKCLFAKFQRHSNNAIITLTSGLRSPTHTSTTI
jgi:hypothetical protein